MSRWFGRPWVSVFVAAGAIVLGGCGGSSNHSSAYSSSSTSSNSGNSGASATSASTTTSAGGGATGSTKVLGPNTDVSSSTWHDVYVQNLETAHFSAARANAVATCVQQGVSSIGIKTNGEFDAVKADPAKAQAAARVIVGCSKLQ